MANDDKHLKNIRKNHDWTSRSAHRPAESRRYFKKFLYLKYCFNFLSFSTFFSAIAKFVTDNFMNKISFRLINTLEL